MKALLLTFGTRGDVQPFIALGRAILDAGHEVLVAGPACYQPLAIEYAVPYASIDDRWNRLTDEPHIQRALASNYAGVRAKRTALEVVRRTRTYLATALDDIAAAAPEDADVVVHHPMLPGQHLAELLAVPSVPVALQPNWVPTDSFASPMWAPSWLPKRLNRWSYRIAAASPRALLGKEGARWRARLGLKPRHGSANSFRQLDGSASMTLQAFSRHVMPASSRWPTYAPVTGYWTLPNGDAAAGSSLARFVEAGEPPVYFGFGSMRGQNPEAVGDMVTQAVRESGVRAVVVTGAGGIAMEKTDRIHLIDEAPNGWLFPRVAAVVHHGGAGTTADALRAGRPQVVCPFTGDQPYWARRMCAIGVAPEPLPQSELSAARLRKAVQLALRPETASRARELGEQVAAERGASLAVEELLKLVASRST